MLTIVAQTCRTPQRRWILSQVRLTPDFSRCSTGQDGSCVVRHVCPTCTAFGRHWTRALDDHGLGQGESRKSTTFGDDQGFCESADADPAPMTETGGAESDVI